MRLVRIALLGSLVSLVSLSACGDNGGTGVDNDPYDTYQACFDDHHKEEMFTVVDAIRVCCIDHPIGGVDMNVVCGDSSTTCQTYVNANLADADATSAEIVTACDDYVQDRSM